MKYVTSYDPALGKQIKIVAENAREMNMLNITRGVLAQMGPECGEATTGHQPYFNYNYSGHGGLRGSDDKPGSLGFKVVTFSHKDSDKHLVHRSRRDKKYFLTPNEQDKKRNSK
jgi:hypothetical protein